MALFRLIFYAFFLPKVAFKKKAAAGILEGPFRCPRLGIETDGIRAVLAFVDAALDRIISSNGEAVMLVISRRQGESVWIGDQIKIVVCTMRGKRVSLGIAAPRHVSVVRDELKQADLERALAASGLTDTAELEITRTDLLREV